MYWCVHSYIWENKTITCENEGFWQTIIGEPIDKEVANESLFLSKLLLLLLLRQVSLIRHIYINKYQTMYVNSLGMIHY